MNLHSLANMLRLWTDWLETLNQGLKLLFLGMVIGLVLRIVGHCLGVP